MFFGLLANEPGTVTTFLDWVEKHRFGELANVAGVLMSLFGLVASVVAAYKAKGAEKAARDARKSIRLLDTIVDFSAAISILEEIKRLHRQRAWPILPDRYAILRKLLISIRSSPVKFSDEQSVALQNAITNLATLEARVEKAMSNSSDLLPAKFNRAISSDLDRLVVVLTQIRASSSGSQQ